MMVAHHKRGLDYDAHLTDRLPQLARPFGKSGPKTAVIQQASKESSFLFGGASHRHPDLASGAERMIRSGDSALSPGEKEFTHGADSPRQARFTFSLYKMI